MTIRYRTTSSFGNIVQKGQNGVPGGYWKLEVWVDGRRRGVHRMPAGRIDNRAPFAVGGKARCGGDITCDYSFGDLNHVRVTKG